MNLDTLARTHSEKARQTTADAHIPDVASFPHRKRLRAVGIGLAWSTSAVAVTVLVLFFGAAGGDLAPPVDPADEMTATTVVATTTATAEADVDSSNTLLHDDPPVMSAELGPESRFDTSALGDEQPLVPVEELSHVTHEMLDGGWGLDATTGFAVGNVPGSDRTILVLDGTITTPAEAGYGEDGRCIWVRDIDSTDWAGECHQILPGAEVRPIAVGLIGVDWVGWEFLPDEAAVAVLTVDGVDRFWQRPRGGVAVFASSPDAGTNLEVRLLDADGVEIARGDRTRPDEPTESTVEPIPGYGDFSDVAYEDVDWVEVNRLIVECMNDRGYAATQVPTGDGFTFQDIPESQNQAAQVVAAACRAGLRLPEMPR